MSFRSEHSSRDRHYGGGGGDYDSHRRRSYDDDRYSGGHDRRSNYDGQGRKQQRDGRGYSIDELPPRRDVDRRGSRGAANYYESDRMREEKDDHFRRVRSHSYDGFDRRNIKRSDRYADDDSYDSRDRSYRDDSRGGRHLEFGRDRRPSDGDSRGRDRIRKGERKSRSPSIDSDSKDENEHGQDEPIEPKKANDWPPTFEAMSSSFVFDARSGMFWEAESQFFYDPKTKLYYSNTKRTYYRYDDTKTPPFVAVQTTAPAELSNDATTESNTETSLTVSQNSSQNTESTEPSNPGIKIAIRTKKLKRSNQSKNESGTDDKVKPTIQKNTSTTPSLSREEQNIEKWSRQQASRQKGASDDSASTGGGSASPPTTASQIRFTAKGEPICVICKRKFPTVEKLRLHEKASQLHKQNLEKLKAAQEEASSKKRSPESANTTTYVDRAAKRRLMHHGTELSSIKQTLSRHNNVVDTVASIPVSNPNDSSESTGTDLNSSNVGHKMLQKMGWKPSGGGSNKSKEGKSHEDAVAEDPSKSVGNGPADRLRQDWDRIEHLARSNNGR